jgi:hypothetical protein
MEMNDLREYLRTLNIDLGELSTRWQQFRNGLISYYNFIKEDLMKVYEKAAIEIGKKGIIDLPSDLSAFFVNNLNDSNATSVNKYHWVSFVLYQDQDEDSLEPPVLQIKDDLDENTYPNNFYKLFTVEGYEKVRENLTPFYDFLLVFDKFFMNLINTCTNSINNVTTDSESRTVHTDLAGIMGLVYNIKLHQALFSQLVDYAPLMGELVLTFDAMVEKYKRLTFTL